MKTFIDEIQNIAFKKKIQCYTCSFDIPNNIMVQHTVNHYNHSGLSAEICKFCNNSIDTNSVESILEHMICEHKMKSSCPICENDFQSMDHLYFHLQTGIKKVYHCGNSNCLFMIDKQVDFRKHLFKMKHKKRFNFTETIFFCRYGENINLLIKSNDYENKCDNNSQYKSYSCSITKNEIFEKLRDNFFDNDFRQKLHIVNDKENIKTHLKENFQLESDSKSARALNSQKLSYNLTYSEKVLRKYAIAVNLKNANQLNENLKLLVKYPIVVSVDENVKKYSCYSCEYLSFNSETEIKRHIFLYHCKISKIHHEILMKVSKCDPEMKLISDKEMIKEINQEILGRGLNNFVSLTDDDTGDKKIDNKKTFHACTYSKNLLAKYIQDSKQVINEDLSGKLKTLGKYLMSVSFVDNSRRYKCESCSYYTLKSHGYIRRHIIGRHCGITNKNRDLAMKVTKFDLESDVIPNDVEIEKDDNNPCVISLLTDNEEHEQNSRKSFHNFTFSKRIFTKFLSVSLPSIKKELEIKLKDFNQIVWFTLAEGIITTYNCTLCNYSSNKSHNDLKLHILHYHCGISSNNLYFAMMITRCHFDKNNLPDHKMIDQINNDISLVKLGAHSLLTDSEDDSVVSVPIKSDERRERSYNKKDLTLINRINFQFSVKILEALCNIEKCLDKVQFLTEALKDYSNYAVEIFQRNRIYLYMCSNCNWYSRNNIQEVSTHVLYDHQNLEKQSANIKEIVQFCCKMNDNGQLLSDKEISDLKWKGRNILD